MCIAALEHGCVLQPCLGGDGKTLMFVNVNCAPDSVKETLCSLRFAAKVNQCETGAKGGARKHVSHLAAADTSTAAAAEVSTQVKCMLSGAFIAP